MRHILSCTILLIYWYSALLHSHSIIISLLILTCCHISIHIVDSPQKWRDSFDSFVSYKIYKHMINTSRTTIICFVEVDYYICNASNKIEQIPKTNQNAPTEYKRQTVQWIIQCVALMTGPKISLTAKVENAELPAMFVFPLDEKWVRGNWTVTDSLSTFEWQNPLVAFSNISLGTRRKYNTEHPSISCWEFNSYRGTLFVLGL